LYVTRIVLGKAYDVTEFSQDHPGGPDLLLMHAGKDITEVMKDGGHKHSEAAYNLLNKYYIGYVNRNAEKECECNSDLVSKRSFSEFLDLSKPLWQQMWNCTFRKEYYLKQVHIARHTKDGSPATIFGNILEPLTKTPWYIIPTIWLPVVSFTLYACTYKYSIVNSFILFFFGVFHWTILEYFIHRFLFHIEGCWQLYILYI
jgi:4-hydroxysphinganine ceramide fatty acyl 2-hydroxylase